MIDGVKVACPSACASVWLACDLLDFGVVISEATGEVKSRTKQAERHGLTFSIMGHTAGAAGYCQILGSLHRFSNQGRDNLDDFTLNRLQTTLSELQIRCGVDPNRANLQTLEIGVNIPLDYPPDVIIRNVISHRGRAYTPIYAGRRKVGKMCVYTDYTIKLYDKGQQFPAAGNLLRFEFKALRQRVLEPFGVRTLADLMDKVKALRLGGLLLDKLADTVFYDFSFRGNELTEAQRLRFERYSNPNYWAQLDRRTLYKEGQRFAKLLEKYGCIDWREYCLKQVAEKLAELADRKVDKGRHFPRVCDDPQAVEKATFSTLEYMVESVAQSTTPGDALNNEKNGLKTGLNTELKQPRFCAVCGREITGQKAGSLFCSERLYGIEARRCRNRDSNRRLAIKRKIYGAMKKELMLRITYRHEGAEYTDTLGASELSITREWLDKVTRVEVLKPQPTALTGNEAKQHLQQIQ